MQFLQKLKPWQLLVLLSSFLFVLTFVGATAVLFFYNSRRASEPTPVATHEPTPVTSPAPSPIENDGVIMMLGVERGEHLLIQNDLRRDAQHCDSVVAFVQSEIPGYVSVLVADGEYYDSMSPSDVYPLVSETYHEIGFQAARITPSDKPVIVVIIWTYFKPDLSLYPIVLDLVASQPKTLATPDFYNLPGHIKVTAFAVDVIPDTHNRFDLATGTCIQ